MSNEIEFENNENEWNEAIYIGALEKERDWIYERLDAIRQWAFGEGVAQDAAVLKEYWALNTRLNYIIAQIAAPDEETLWTCDEISAQITEEELAKAKERENSARKQYGDARDYCVANPGSPYGEKQSNRWLEILWIRQEEVFRLENLLIDNPASGWLPF